MRYPALFAAWLMCATPGLAATPADPESLSPAPEPQLIITFKAQDGTTATISVPQACASGLLQDGVLWLYRLVVGGGLPDMQAAWKEAVGCLNERAEIPP